MQTDYITHLAGVKPMVGIMLFHEWRMHVIKSDGNVIVVDIGVNGICFVQRVMSE